MATVRVAVEIGEGANVSVSREMEWFECAIGKWAVSLSDGNLIVRAYPYGGHTQPLLKVEA